MPDCLNTRLLAQLAGAGAGTMQIIGHRGYLYIGELIAGGTQIVDARDPAHPRRVGRLDGYPGSYSPKVQVGDDRLLVNYEARREAATFVGLGLWDITHPEQPTSIAKIESSGKGIHRMWYTGGTRAYVSPVPGGFSSGSS